MENITKAIYMVAGVLIGLLILAAFVWVFSNGGKFLASFEDSGNIKQAEQYNADLLVYQKDNNTIYDVVSAIHKAQDINEQNLFDQSNSLQIVVNGICSLDYNNQLTPATTKLTELIEDYGNLIDYNSLTPEEQEQQKNERIYERYFTGQITYGDQGKINLITFN